MTSQLLQLAASLMAILFLAWLAQHLKLGGVLRIDDEAHARELAEEIDFSFDPVDVAIDQAGLAALMKDSSGRHLLVRPHGARFAGRILDRRTHCRLNQNLLIIGTGERTFGTMTLDLGDDAQTWAAGLSKVAQ